MKKIFSAIGVLLSLLMFVSAGSNPTWDFLLSKGYVDVDSMSQCDIMIDRNLCPDANVPDKSCQIYSPKHGCDKCTVEGVDEKCLTKKVNPSVFRMDYEFQKPSSDYTEKEIVLTVREAGKITGMEGHVYIFRYGDYWKAKVNSKLKSGDYLIIGSDSKATLNIAQGIGLIKLGEKTVYHIVHKRPDADKNSYAQAGYHSKWTLFWGGIWIKFKKTFAAEDMEVYHREVTAGVRG